MTTASTRADKAGQSSGLLKPYKPGQGFWTRLGTGLGAALIILFTIYFLYDNLPVWVRTTSTQTLDAPALAALEEQARNQPSLRVLLSEPVANGFEVTTQRTLLPRDNIWLYAVLAFVALVMGTIAWWLINRPKHAEFLIATDGEMKKVNWTTWQELIGSTKVVVCFMFFLAFMLFSYDIIFGYLFYMLDVLKIAPFTV
jgi:preprotein translocase SecE subunit